MIRRGVIIALGLLVLWYVLVKVLQLPNYLVPLPTSVVRVMWQNPLLIWQQTWPTVVEALLGFVIAAVSGIYLAVMMVLFRPVKAWVQPIIVVSQALPTFAIAPLIVLWLGYGMASKIVVITIALFFPVTAALFDGFCRCAHEWLDQAATYQAGCWRTLRYIQLPAALPALGSGLKMAAAWAPLAAVVSEWVGSERGLGFLMINANARMQVSLTFAALVVLVVFSLLFYGLVSLWVRRAWYW